MVYSESRVGEKTPSSSHTIMKFPNIIEKEILKDIKGKKLIHVQKDLELYSTF